jgi:hypothetical protein
MGLNATTQRIYLPADELEPATTGRSRLKPATFMIVEVGH